MTKISSTTPSLSQSGLNERLRVFLHALLFVLGFSLVFVIGWGGSVTALGQLFGAYKRVIAQIGGVIVIMFGLATLEVIRIPWFYADTRAQYSGQRGTIGGSTLMGINAFSSRQAGVRASARLSERSLQWDSISKRWGKPCGYHRDIRWGWAFHSW